MEVSKDVDVTFIPKAGENFNVSAKNFRSISLSSFPLKILERLMDWYVRNRIPWERLRACNCRIKTKDFLVGTILNIEESFKNALTETTVKALSKRESKTA